MTKTYKEVKSGYFSIGKPSAQNVLLIKKNYATLMARLSHNKQNTFMLPGGWTVLDVTFAWSSDSDTIFLQVKDNRIY